MWLIMLWSLSVCKVKKFFKKTRHDVGKNFFVDVVVINPIRVGCSRIAQVLFQ